MMKLIIEIESDHEMLLTKDYDVSKVLRELADDLVKNTIFTRNEFKCELKDQFGECTVGFVTHTKGEVNDYTVTTNDDKSVTVTETPKPIYQVFKGRTY
jgi:hypothetical protein